MMRWSEKLLVYGYFMLSDTAALLVHNISLTRFCLEKSSVYD